MRFALIAAACFSATTTAFASDPACVERLQDGMRAGLIKDMSVTSAGVLVVVDEAVWSGIQFQSKQGVLDTLTCAFVEPGQALNRVTFLSDLTNRPVGEARGRTLTIPD